MKLVILESPYAGEIEANVAYARRALRHSVEQREAPIASHLLYTQVLDDSVSGERIAGVEAGLAWLQVADGQIFYLDRGFSNGMKLAMQAGKSIKRGRDFGIYARWIDGPVDLSVLGQYERYIDGCSGARRD